MNTLRKILENIIAVALAVTFGYFYAFAGI